MLFLNSVYDIFSVCFMFLFGGGVSFVFSSYFRVSKGCSLLLYVWHTVFCLVYFFYSLDNPADAKKYYIDSFDFDGVGVGTTFVKAFVSYFSVGLDFPYASVFLLFNLFGFMGLIAFYGALRQLVEYKSKGVKWLAFASVLLPSISFWSSAIGKDAISFMSVGFALWASVDLRKRIGLMAFAVIVMLLVRPHMAGMMIVALSIALFFDKKASFIRRLFLGVIAFFTAVILVPFAIQYAGLVELSQLLNFIDSRQGYNQGGGSSLDISSMGLPMQLFTYAFRPLPYEAHNITALLSSLDNLYLLMLLVLGLYGRLRYGLQKKLDNILFIVAYVGAAWLVLAMTTSNLGIAVRQKWMFMPMVIFLIFSAFPNNRHRSQQFSQSGF